MATASQRQAIERVQEWADNPAGPHYKSTPQHYLRDDVRVLLAIIQKLEAEATLRLVKKKRRVRRAI